MDVACRRDRRTRPQSTNNQFILLSVSPTHHLYPRRSTHPANNQISFMRGHQDVPVLSLFLFLSLYVRTFHLQVKEPPWVLETATQHSVHQAGRGKGGHEGTGPVRRQEVWWRVMRLGTEAERPVFWGPFARAPFRIEVEGFRGVGLFVVLKFFLVELLSFFPCCFCYLHYYTKPLHPPHARLNTSPPWINPAQRATGPYPVHASPAISIFTAFLLIGLGPRIGPIPSMAPLLSPRVALGSLHPSPALLSNGSAYPSTLCFSPWSIPPASS
ncbi:hypothetical protein BD779DRAFT_1676109 [Infundibulicybe gibba]|nr:hypothetical protein BD779DRAFT_1676109 [Infundibulicybe gibba]